MVQNQVTYYFSVWLLVIEDRESTKVHVTSFAIVPFQSNVVYLMSWIL